MPLPRSDAVSLSLLASASLVEIFGVPCNKRAGSRRPLTVRLSSMFRPCSPGADRAESWRPTAYSAQRRARKKERGIAIFRACSGRSPRLRRGAHAVPKRAACPRLWRFCRSGSNEKKLRYEKTTLGLLQSTGPSAFKSSRTSWSSSPIPPTDHFINILTRFVNIGRQSSRISSAPEDQKGAERGEAWIGKFVLDDPLPGCVDVVVRQRSSTQVRRLAGPRRGRAADVHRQGTGGVQAGPERAFASAEQTRSARRVRTASAPMNVDEDSVRRTDNARPTEIEAEKSGADVDK